MISNHKTIVRVAELAEVSTATVSRVINGSAKVLPETRDRVLAAMRQLNYTYNALAGGLSRQRTMTLGLVVPTISNPIFAESTRGVQETARAAQYAILMGNSEYRADYEADLVNIFQQHRVDGMVVTSSHPESPALITIHQSGTPIVLTYSYRPRSALPSVGVDNQAAAAEAVGYLIRLGHRRIAMLAGTFSESDRSHARYSGYRAALLAHGLPPDPALTCEMPYTFAAGAAAIATLLQLPEPPTALFCANDILALGALRAALDRDIAVPSQLSIIGFDDSPMAALANPRLTTVAQPAYLIGQRATTLLIGLLAGELPPTQPIVLPTTLHIRATTAPPPMS
jgi:DNA-binding LacI/PurR family transcriptional regulator